MTRLVSSSSLRLVLVAALGAGFALLALRAHWLESVDLKVYDLGLGARPARVAVSDVVVVAMDKYSRQMAFPPPEFPISAHVKEHALVIDRLTRAGARAVAFDVLFDQLAPDLDVAPLAASLRVSGRVCMAAAVERQTLALRGDGSAITEERLVIPSERLGDAVYCLGLVNMPVDGDGVARRSSFGRVFQGRALPSMSAVLAAAADGAPLGKAWGDSCGQWIESVVEGSRDSTFYIDYRFARGGITVIPYAEVLSSDGWRDEVRGRVVLVGVTENGLGDIYGSPTLDLAGAAKDNRLPGSMVIAYAAQTLIGRSLVWPMAHASVLALCLGLAVVASVVALGRRLWVSVVLILGLIFCIFAAGVLLSALRLAILPAGAAMGVMLFTGAVGLLAGYVQTRVIAELQQRELAEISDDLKKAAQIQQSLQPTTIPAMEGFALAGFQIPCKEIGGDYYDVLALGGGKVALVIADVCGKGVAAALLMSNLQSSVRQLAPTAFSTRKMVVDLNKAAIRVFTDGRFVTLLYGILDPGKMEFSYCCAGHMPPIVCRSDGEVAELPQGGIPIGILPEFPWQEHTVRLASGDVLFMYTDGLSEAGRKKTGELFGEDRIKAFLKTNSHLSPEALNSEIVREAQGFSGSVHLADDITLLTLKAPS